MQSYNNFEFSVSCFQFLSACRPEPQLKTKNLRLTAQKVFGEFYPCLYLCTPFAVKNR